MFLSLSELPSAAQREVFLEVVASKVGVLLAAVKSCTHLLMQALRVTVITA
jgi:hypothetical protein